MTPQKLFRIVAALVLVSTSLALPATAQPKPMPGGDATLQGIVYDSKHHPVTGADVSLQAGAGAPVRKARTDANGAYKFSALSEGTYRIQVAAAEKGAATSLPVVLAAQDAKTLDVTLTDASLAFFDEPTFSVAGVTDTTNLGGHGSDTVVRTRSALAKETASLSESLSSHATATPDAKPYPDAASGGGRDTNARDAQQQAEAHHRLATVAEHSGDPLAAVREYQRAAELDPSEPNIFDWGAELLLHHAAEPATEVFSNGHRLFPQSVRVLVGLGVAWYVRGSYEQAAQRLCEAADLAPKDPTPYSFLAKIINIESSESAGIASRFERYVSLEPQNAAANYYYALSLWKQGRGSGDSEIAAQVQVLLEKAIALDPKLGEAFLQLGIVQSERKDFAQAIASYRKAIELAPRMEQAHYRLAQAYRISGQNEKAKDELEVYEKLSKENVADSERERREVKQFVYTMREKGSGEQ